MNQTEPKEKREKGKKQLLFFAFGILILLLLLVWKGIDSSGKDQTDAAKHQMVDELQHISDYLTEVDGNVVENQNKVADMAAGSQEDLQAVQEHLKQLKGFVIHNKELITQYYKEENEGNQEINSNLLLIQNQLDAANEQISMTEKNITVILENMASNTETKYEALEVKLAEINTSVEQINNSLLTAQSSILKALEILQKGNEIRHEKLILVLTEMEQDIAGSVNANIGNINQSLNVLTNGLQGKLKEIHEQILQTQTEIAGILRDMEEQNTKNHAAIVSKMEKVNASVIKIDEDLGQVYEDIKQLILNLQQEGNDNHAETIETLRTMEESVQNDLENKLVQMNESFQTLSSSMENSFTSLNSGIEQNFSETISQVNNQFANVNTILTNQDEGLRSYFEGKLGALNLRLDSVFQYVSSGKRKVASALLTKGVSVREDATFKEITDAILSIPQKIVIRAEQIPGKVTYEYHYHTDGAGNTPQAEKVPAGQKGGCFSVPICHVHTGDSKDGGGCYSIPFMHKHESRCHKTTRTVEEVFDYWFTGEGTGHGCCDSSHGQNYAKYRYRVKVYVDGELVSSTDKEGDLGYCCGLCVAGKAYSRGKDSTTTTLICEYTEGLNGHELGCGKTAETVESYTPACGFSNGQITAAHIVYDKEAAGAAMAEQNLPENTENAEAENGESEEKASTEDEETDSSESEVEENTEKAEAESTESEPEESTEIESNQ